MRVESLNTNMWTRHSDFTTLKKEKIQSYSKIKLLLLRWCHEQYIACNLPTLYEYFSFLICIIHHRNTRWHIHHSSGSTCLVHCGRYDGPQRRSFVLAPNVQLQLSVNSVIKSHQLFQIAFECGHLDLKWMSHWAAFCSVSLRWLRAWHRFL